MGAIDTTYTFTATDTITSTKMNNIIDQTTITSDAIIGTTLEVASGKLKVRSANITSNELATNAVTTAAITDLNVTTGKIADIAVTTGKIADLAVTTGKIADLGVTTAKIADANVTPAKLSEPYTLGTAQATTSGTSIDFTGIPSWAKRITVLFSGFSTNGTSLPIIQVGAGSITTSGYLGAASRHRVDSTNANFTDGFGLTGTIAATSVIHGIMTINKITGNTWVASFSGGASDDTHAYSGGGNIVLSGSLDRIRLTTQGGVNTFDAGQVNIMYE